MARQKEYNRRRADEKRKENQKNDDKETKKWTSITSSEAIAAASFSGRSLRGTVRKSSCALFAVERADSGKISSVAAGIVDGVNIKPDTWYTCRDGKLKEVGK